MRQIGMYVWVVLQNVIMCEASWPGLMHIYIPLRISPPIKICESRWRLDEAGRRTVAEHACE